MQFPPPSPPKKKQMHSLYLWWYSHHEWSGHAGVRGSCAVLSRLCYGCCFLYCLGCDVHLFGDTSVNGTTRGSVPQHILSCTDILSALLTFPLHPSALLYFFTCLPFSPFDPESWLSSFSRLSVSVSFRLALASCVPAQEEEVRGTAGAGVCPARGGVPRPPPQILTTKRCLCQDGLS